MTSFSAYEALYTVSNVNINFYLVSFGHKSNPFPAKSCRFSYKLYSLIFQSSIVPVSEEKLAPILYSGRASEAYSRA